MLCLVAFLKLGMLGEPWPNLTWLAKKCPMILTMTSSFSSGVWSRGTMTSALVKFCSSFTWSKQQRHRFCWGRAKILPYWCCPSSEPGHGTRLLYLTPCLSPWDGAKSYPQDMGLGLRYH